MHRNGKGIWRFAAEYGSIRENPAHSRRYPGGADGAKEGFAHPAEKPGLRSSRNEEARRAGNI